MLSCVILTAVLSASVLVAAAAPDLLQFHKEAFEKTFHDTCDKYPFVAEYLRKLEHSDERYLVFVYQENGLRNGGLGDKLGGLVSAVTMALRFNRTLILRSHNDMHEVFRPYHPTDIHSPTPKYSWANITSWSNYDVKYANNDATEYDLYDCINNTGQKNAHCSMKDADAPTPHILYRSNRAYLCYYDNNKGSLANQQMQEILGVNSTTDLYEVAGCMLRLALWPTELLWAEVGKQLHEFQSSLSDGTAGGSRGGSRRLAADQNEHTHLRNRRLEDSPVPVGQETTTLASSASTRQKHQTVVQIGMHFRCGDNSYIKHGGYDHMCVHAVDDTEEVNKKKFPLGNPYDIGLCARRALHTRVTEIVEGALRGSNTNGNTGIVPPGMVAQINDIMSVEDVLSMAFIASDNLMSSLQMNMTLGIPHTIVSPQGCHIEMDPSKQCHLFTASQWFMLALSDIIVTQAGIPSSFSRYAGIYGLKPNPFRNGQDCDAAYSSLEYCRKPISNWFC